MKVRVTKIYQLDHKHDIRRMTIEELMAWMEMVIEEGQVVQETKDLIKDEDPR